jgi:hypothetical protein
MKKQINGRILSQLETAYHDARDNKYLQAFSMKRLSRATSFQKFVVINIVIFGALFIFLLFRIARVNELHARIPLLLTKARDAAIEDEQEKVAQKNEQTADAPKTDAQKADEEKDEEQIKERKREFMNNISYAVDSTRESIPEISVKVAGKVITKAVLAANFFFLLLMFYGALKPLLLNGVESTCEIVAEALGNYSQELANSTVFDMDGGSADAAVRNVTQEVFSDFISETMILKYFCKPMMRWLGNTLDTFEEHLRDKSREEDAGERRLRGVPRTLDRAPQAARPDWVVQSLPKGTYDEDYFEV